MNLQDYALDLLETVLALSETTQEGEFQENVFTQEALEVLTECEAAVDPQVCYYRSLPKPFTKTQKVNAYDYLADSDELDLFVTDFSTSEDIRRIPHSEVIEDLDRCRAMLEGALKQSWFELEESTDVWALSRLIWEERETLRSVKLFLLTNRLASPESVSLPPVGDIEVSCQVWDIERFFQVDTGRKGASVVTVDFDEDGAGVACVRSENPEGGYDAYLGIMDGSVLASIYGRWGQRLLERNVRSFLQARGSVNRGIRDTLNSEPAMFLPYNNGISATADTVVTEETEAGIRIRSADNFQIVNGGQTTASVYEAWRRKVDLSGVGVQIKITVLHDTERVDEVVPLISRYANSQTKVSFSDLTANDPFHVELERLSREIWVPSIAGKSTTHWYYERARGGYLNDKNRNETRARIRAWELQNPKGQKLTKTLVAKYEMAWLQQPHRVSEGAEKNYAHFSIRLRDNPIRPEARYFQRLVAKAILFRETDRIVRNLGFGGYKANVVAYTVSWLSFLTNQRLKLDEIWNTQDHLTNACVTLSTCLQKKFGNTSASRRR